MADTSFEGRHQRSTGTQHPNDRPQCPPNATPTMRAAYTLRDSNAIRLEYEIDKLMRKLVDTRSPEIESQIRALRRIRDPRVVQLGTLYRMQQVNP